MMANHVKSNGFTSLVWECQNQVYQKKSGFVSHAKISSGSQSRGNLHVTTSINFSNISVL